MHLIDQMKQGLPTEENIRSLFDAYNDALIKRNAIDLNDLIFLTVNLFKDNPEVLLKYREKYLWIMVDEFQDINAMQYELIKLLAGGEGENSSSSATLTRQYTVSGEPISGSLKRSVTNIPR